nr:unnamed protein product [Digitaria exilis]
MVFKGRFFSSRHKSSESSSSPDGSNSLGSASAPSLASSSRSDKKKTKSETLRKPDKLFDSAAAAHNSAASSASSSSAGDGRESVAQLRDASGGGASAAAPSPIMASSLGLNQIKTTSGPLPPEGQRMAAALGSSNLSRGQSQAEPSDASGGVGGRKGVSSSADSSTTSRGKGKTAEMPMRTAAGTSLGAEGKSAVKANSSALQNYSGDLKTPTHRPEAVEVLKVIQMRFEKAKEEVNSDLAVFAGDLMYKAAPVPQGELR